MDVSVEEVLKRLSVLTEDELQQLADASDEDLFKQILTPLVNEYKPGWRKLKYIFKIDEYGGFSESCSADYPEEKFPQPISLMKFGFTLSSAMLEMIRRMQDENGKIGWNVAVLSYTSDEAFNIDFSYDKDVS